MTEPNHRKPPTPPGKGVKKSRLTFVQRVQTLDSLRANLGSISEGRLTFSEAAAFLSNQMAFVITPVNLKNLCAEMGIRWPRGSRGNSRLNIPTKRQLVLAILVLYNKLGIPVPECLHLPPLGSQD